MLTERHAQYDTELIERAIDVIEVVERSDPYAVKVVGVNLERVKAAIQTIRNVEPGIDTVGTSSERPDFGDRGTESRPSGDSVTDGPPPSN
jgi:hypothetical protein